MMLAGEETEKAGSFVYKTKLNVTHYRILQKLKLQVALQEREHPPPSHASQDMDTISSPVPLSQRLLCCLNNIPVQMTKQWTEKARLKLYRASLPNY